jgi:hypothetical protein
MAYTRWLLVQQPDLGFRFVTRARYGDFHSGRVALPQVRPGEVRTVEVVLRREQRAVAEVIHAEHRLFPVLPSGHRDPASVESEMRHLQDIVDIDSSTRPGAERGQWAAGQLARTFRWTPTDREAREIADLVSARAEGRSLGGRRLRLVEPDPPRRAGP